MITRAPETGDTARRPARQRRRSSRPQARGLLAVRGVMIYPLVWLVSARSSPSDQILTEPGCSPTDWTLDNYTDGWTRWNQPFPVFLVNSLDRHHRRHHRQPVLLLAGGVRACPAAVHGPEAVLRRHAGHADAAGPRAADPAVHLLLPARLVNTYLPLLMPKFLATDAFFIFLMVQFIRALPRELDEAARSTAPARSGRSGTSSCR